MNERKPLLPSLATAFLSALILLAGCAKGTGTTNAQCSTNQEECNGTCVNVQTDNQNCGSCGNDLRRRHRLFERIVRVRVGSGFVRWPVRRVQRARTAEPAAPPAPAVRFASTTLLGDRVRRAR